MKLTPASRAFATIRVEVASSVGPPNIMAPRQIGEIFRPLRPRLRYCMGWVLYKNGSTLAPSPRSSRGEGWGEGLSPRVLKHTMRGDVSTDRHCERKRSYPSHHAKKEWIASLLALTGRAAPSPLHRSSIS